MKRNFGIAFGGTINQNIDSTQTTQTLCSTAKESLSISKTDFENVDPQKFQRFIAELNQYEEKDVVGAKQSILSVMNAQYASSEEEFRDYLAAWKNSKKNLSERARQVLAVAGDIAGITSFLLMLLGV